MKSNLKSSDWVYGYHALKTLLSTHPEYIQKVLLQTNRKDARGQEIVALAGLSNISTQYISRHEMEQLIGEESQHQGMAAQCTRLPKYDESDLNKLLALQTDPYLLLILDGVQDPHNLGACLRSAHAFGVQMVISPKDQAATITPTVRKVASGAAEAIPFIQVTNLARTIRKLRDEGVWLIGTAAEANVPLSEVDLTGNIGVVMGGEGKGLRQLTRKHCDYLAKIPIQGDMESLNVSVATGICLYEVTRQRTLK